MQRKQEEKLTDKLQLENDELKARLSEAEATLEAIRRGEVDAIVVEGEEGEQIYSISSAETPYRIILEEMNEGTVTISESGLILYCNKRFAEQMNEPIEHIIGTQLKRLFPVEEHNLLESLFSKETTKRTSGILTPLHQSGKIKKFLRLSVSSIPPGMIGRYCILTMDITDLMKRESELKQMHELFEKTSREKTGELQEKIKSLNESRFAVMNMMEETLDARAELEKSNKQLLQEIEERKVVEDNLRKLNRVYAVLSNINQTIVRERYEKNLFDEICKIAIKDGKFIWSWIGKINKSDGSVTVMSESGKNKFKSDLTGKVLIGKILGSGPTATAIKTGSHSVFNNVDYRKHITDTDNLFEEREFVSCSSFPIKVFGKLYGVVNFYSEGNDFFDDEEIRLLHEVSIDIAFAVESIYNEEKKITAEKELIKAKDKAEELNRLKSNFLANMSHELRTPMVAILGFSDILIESLNDVELKKFAEMINLGGTRLMETLNLILDLSLIEAEKLKIETSRFDLVKLVKDIMNLFEKVAANKNLFLEIETKIDVLFVQLDFRLVTQVLNNLINNAIKYTLQGGVTVYIDMEILNETEYAAIKVKDTGIGIPKDKHEIIWEEYRQVSDGLGRSFEGTGLGLTITKNFVEKSEGKIFVESSEPGIGTTFKVVLPVNENLMHTGMSIPKNIQSNSKKIKEEATNKIIEAEKNILPEILYVEDEDSAVSVVKIFTGGICLLDVAKDSVECLKKVKSKKYHVILMDINLGKGTNGLKTAEMVKMIPGYENVPIVAVTAYAMVGDKEEFLSKGCTHYISKPFGRNQLVSLIEELVDGKR